MGTHVVGLLAIFVTVPLAGSLKAISDDPIRAKSAFEAGNQPVHFNSANRKRHQGIHARSAIYNGITKVFSQMNKETLTAIMAEQKPFWKKQEPAEVHYSGHRKKVSSVFSLTLDDLLEDGLPLEYENHIQVSCVTFTFTQYVVVRIHVYDSCLYIDKDLDNFWGRNMTLPELKAALPGHAFHMTWFDTVHIKKNAMERLLQKNVQMLESFGTMSKARAEELVDAYGKMWATSPELHRGSILKQEILLAGMNVTLDGQNLNTVPGPGIELMVAEPALKEEYGENEGLDANRENIFKSILRGNNITDETRRPEHVYIYTHEQA